MSLDRFKSQEYLNIKKPISVDVYCSVYNHDKYISQALDGILMQKTNFPVRVIIHDDASTDKSALIIKEYQAKYPKQIFAVLEEENLYQNGKSKFQKILPFLTSKYIAFCEGDDFWIDKGKLQKQVDYLEQHDDCSAIYHNILPVNKFGKYDETLRGVYALLNEGDYSNEELARFIIKTQTASLVVKNCFNKMSKEEKRIYHGTKYVNGDIKMLIFFGAIGRVHYLADVMAAHRRVFDEGDSFTARYAKKKLNVKFIESQFRYIEQCKLYECFTGKTVNLYNFILEQQIIYLWLLLKNREKIDSTVFKVASIPFSAYFHFLPFIIYKCIKHACRNFSLFLHGELV